MNPFWYAVIGSAAFAAFPRFLTRNARGDALLDGPEIGYVRAAAIVVAILFLILIFFQVHP